MNITLKAAIDVESNNIYQTTNSQTFSTENDTNKTDNKYNRMKLCAK